MESPKNLLEFKENIPLAQYTTFKIGGKARYFFVAQSRKDLINAIKVAKKLKLPLFILGGGSNVLFSDTGYKGLVIKCQISNVKFPRAGATFGGAGRSRKNSQIYAEAGTKLKDLVNASFKKSLTGLEWAMGIPGTLGGAIFGNAGAFSSTIGDIIASVEVFDTKTFKIKKNPAKSCKFSNKDSIFKKKKNLIILSAILKLKKGEKREIKKKIKECSNYRKKNHPLNFSSAGCVFKNCNLKIQNKKLLKKFPELNKFNQGKNIPAAYLIEKCRLKGKKIGQAQISEKHANFIINLGKAKAREIKKLIKLIRQKVKKKFGITLEEEIQIINSVFHN